MVFSKSMTGNEPNRGSVDARLTASLFRFTATPMLWISITLSYTERKEK